MFYCLSFLRLGNFLYALPGFCKEFEIPGSVCGACGWKAYGRAVGYRAAVFCVELECSFAVYVDGMNICLCKYFVYIVRFDVAYGRIC